MEGKREIPYPVFLNLEDRMCLVVGAGDVAERKTEGLSGSGARVTVIGQGATDGIRRMALSGKIVWEDRDFKSGDTDGAFLVIAATDNSEVNTEVADEARQSRALVNVVDQPDSCDFFSPALVRRGELQIAVSTGGKSPAFAREVRQNIEAAFGPEYAEYLESVGRFRLLARTEISDKGRRCRAYDRLLKSDLLEQIKAGRKVDIESLVKQYAG